MLTSKIRFVAVPGGLLASPRSSSSRASRTHRPRPPRPPRPQRPAPPPRRRGEGAPPRRLEVRQILVDSSGMSLYVDENDKQGSCVPGACFGVAACRHPPRRGRNQCDRFEVQASRLMVQQLTVNGSPLTPGWVTRSPALTGQNELLLRRAGERREVRPRRDEVDRLLTHAISSRSGSSRSPGSHPTGWPFSEVRLPTSRSGVRVQTFGKKSDTMRSSTTGLPSTSVQLVWKYVTSIGPRRA